LCEFVCKWKARQSGAICHINREPSNQFIKLRLQQHDAPASALGFAQNAIADLIPRSAAADSEHHVALRLNLCIGEEVSERLRFRAAPRLFTVIMKNLTDTRCAKFIQRKCVQIEKCTVDSARDQRTDGGLSNTAHADENDADRPPLARDRGARGIGARGMGLRHRRLMRRPSRRLRLMILRPALVFMRARKPIARTFFLRLTLCG